MKIHLIWPRSTADAELALVIDRYLTRIRHFFPVELVEVPAEKNRQAKNDVSIMHAESARLAAAIPPQGTTVVLDERGEMLDSLRFARWFEATTNRGPHGIHFVMGGDLGLDDAMRSRADKILALSPMTLPHQLARVVLVEQIYRACTILRSIRYHK